MHDHRRDVPLGLMRFQLKRKDMTQAGAPTSIGTIDLKRGGIVFRDRRGTAYAADKLMLGSR